MQSASEEREEPDVENVEVDTIGFDEDVMTGVVSDDGVEVDQAREERAEAEEEKLLDSLLADWFACVDNIDDTDEVDEVECGEDSSAFERNAIAFLVNLLLPPALSLKANGEVP